MGYPARLHWQGPRFLSYQVSLPVAFSKSKFSAGIVKDRKHDLDVIRIES
jgi:hypothetical protein